MTNVVIQKVSAICNADDESIPGILPKVLLVDLKTTAARDAEYTTLATTVESGFGTRVFDYIRCAIRHQISTENGLVLFGSRIVIPFASRRNILSTPPNKASSAQNDGPSRRYIGWGYRMRSLCSSNVAQSARRGCRASVRNHSCRIHCLLMY
jgi:hypothetical protein